MSLPTSPELARTNPEQFGVEAIRALGQHSVHGAKLWNYTVSEGARRWHRPLALSATSGSWVSHGNAASGHIVLGAQPLTQADKSRLTFREEQFPYPKEIAYRLLHEISHFYLTMSEENSTPATQGLTAAVTAVRQGYNGGRGLSALGSMPFYTGNHKLVEDATELMAMYAWDPAYLEDYTRFLANPAYEATRQQVGLATIDQPAALYEIVEATVAPALN
jgi:hypothetical protein